MGFGRSGERTAGKHSGFDFQGEEAYLFRDEAVLYQCIKMQGVIMLEIKYLEKLSFGRMFLISLSDWNLEQAGKMPNLDIIPQAFKKWREMFSPYGKMRNLYHLDDKRSSELFEEACVQKLVGNRTANAAMHRLITLAKERDVTISCVTGSLGSRYAKILARVCARTSSGLKVSGA